MENREWWRRRKPDACSFDDAFAFSDLNTLSDVVASSSSPANDDNSRSVPSSCDDDPAGDGDSGPDEDSCSHDNASPFSPKRQRVMPRHRLFVVVAVERPLLLLAQPRSLVSSGAIRALPRLSENRQGFDGRQCLELDAGQDADGRLGDRKSHRDLAGDGRREARESWLNCGWVCCGPEAHSGDCFREFLHGGLCVKREKRREREKEEKKEKNEKTCF